MLHSKQWHYSLHRDFQNCYSTRRSPTGFFSSNSTRVPHTSSIHVCTYTSREFSIQNPILHAEDKELFEYYYYYYIQRAKRPSFQKRNSTHRRQGDLLEMHPCVPRTFQAFQPQDLPKAFIPDIPDIPVFPVFPDIPVVPDTPETFRTFQSFMTFQPFQAILQFYKVPVSPGNPTHYSILRLECIFYKFYRFYSSIGFHRKLHRVPVEQLQTFYKHYILQRKGDVAISVRIDIFSRIELFLQTSCQVKRLITRMTFNSFLSCLMSKVSIEITINTSKWHERAKQWNGNSHISLIS